MNSWPAFKYKKNEIKGLKNGLKKTTTFVLTGLIGTTVLVGSVYAATTKTQTWGASFSAFLLMGFSNISESAEIDVVDRYNSIDRSAQGIQKYLDFVKLKNQGLIQNEVEEIETTITFSKPLSLQEIKKYIADYGIEAQQIVARSLSDGQRITTAFTADGLDQLSVVIKDLHEQHNAEFVGFTHLSGTLNYEEFSPLQNNSLTFLADASADNFFTGAQEGQYPHALTWLLEDISIKEGVKGYYK